MHKLLTSTNHYLLLCRKVASPCLIRFSSFTTTAGSNCDPKNQRHEKLDKYLLDKSQHCRLVSAARLYSDSSR